MKDGISASNVWRILHHQLLYPYLIQRVQGLKNTYFLPRWSFCQQIQQYTALDRQLLNNVLFTDEAGFTRDGIFNFHNCNMWAAINPNEVKQARHQQSFSFNVWVGILGDCLIGPHFSTTQVKWRAVPAFYAECSSKFAWRSVIASTSADVVYACWCTSTFPSKCKTISKQTIWWTVNRQGKTSTVASWITRFKSFGFCIWGYAKGLAKGLVYNTADIATPGELQYRIVHAFQQMKNDSGLLECIRGSLRRRLDGCIQVEGQHSWTPTLEFFR